MIKRRWLIILVGALLGAMLGYACWKCPASGVNMLTANSSMTSGFVIGAVLITILTSPKQGET